MIKTLATLALCDSRHPMPECVTGAIFDTTVNPLDTLALEERACNVLEGVKALNLYVTGLTVALIAVLNVCHRNGILVTLYHYNRDTDSYYPQTVA
jgi:hypothetical protein